jgi:hypothetical protein
MVGRITRNSILKGMRLRNQLITRRINKTGHRRCIKAPPEERLERHCLHLGFIDPIRYDRVIALLEERNRKYRRKGVNGVDTRKGVPNKRTVWPGQHICCGVCGRLYVYGGHGEKNRLMCSGAHEYVCWNAVSVGGPLAARRMITAIREAIVALPDFDPVLVALLTEEIRNQRGSRDQRLQEVERGLASVQRSLEHIPAAIGKAGDSPSLLEELSRMEKEKSQLRWHQQELAREGAAPVAIPSISKVRRLAEDAFGRLAGSSAEFGRLLQRLIPRIVVRPYRLCDGGHLVLRAHFTLQLAPLLPDTLGLERLATSLSRALIVDLFEPSQREVYRCAVMERTSAGLTQRQIAKELSITLPAVQHAVTLQRHMDRLGIRNPYLQLTAPPRITRNSAATSICASVLSRYTTTIRHRDTTSAS